MSSLTEAELEQAGADYRAAKAAVIRTLQAQADAELERHRSGVDDGTVAKLAADVAWCEALVVACGEVYKGCSFDEACSTN